MYNKDSQSLVNEIIMAALGAGIVTTFAMARGQNPFVAMAITGFAAIAAVTLNRYL